MLKPYLAITGMLSALLLIGCATPHKTEHNAERDTEFKAEHKAEPKAEYGQIVTVSRPVKSVSVIVSYQGGAVYRVQVNNALPAAISLVWDKSVYVTTTKESIRLLYIQNKNDLPRYPPRQQVSSLIPSDSRFQADFTGESWLDCVKKGCVPQPRKGLKNARIYLAFNIKGKRVRWRGEIAFVPPAQP